MLFVYELFDLWALPAATAWLVVGYFGVALIVDTTFSGAAFCKHVCPVGQFNFIASTVSPLEVGVRDRSVCERCTTVDCIKGRRDERVPATIVQRGCELGLFLPSKVGNLECTFCLDCVQACPHDNVAISARVPGEELADNRHRSVIGRLHQRADIAALVLLFTFGALMNAFAMTAPVYQIEARVARALRTSAEAPVLGITFIAALGIIPMALCGAAAFVARALAPTRASTPGVRAIAVRYAYALVPFGVGVWLAHYGFHFLTGIWTIVPVTQSAAIDATGRALLGAPDWRWLGMRPGAVFPLQLGATLLGAMGSLMLVHRLAEHDRDSLGPRAAIPWSIFVVGLTAVAWWILAQPMDMRGTWLGG
ncbi:MAG: hypothetical protein QM736_00825 [Vicinamibacterales bacterium]